MTDTMTIRRATPDDGPALRAMHRASLRSLGAQFYPAPTIETFLAEVSTLDETLLTEGTCLVIEVGGEIVASGAWTLRPPAYGGHLPPEAGKAGARHATIRSVFTHPRYARLGLASKIMECCETEAAVRGAAAGIDLVATLAAVPLYQKLGYRPVAPFSVPLTNGTCFDATFMTKAFALSAVA